MPIHLVGSVSVDALAIDSMDYSQRRAHQGGAAVVSLLPAPSPDAQKRERKRSLPGVPGSFPPLGGRVGRPCVARVNLL